MLDARQQVEAALGNLETVILAVDGRWDVFAKEHFEIAKIAVIDACRPDCMGITLGSDSKIGNGSAWHRKCQAWRSIREMGISTMLVHLAWRELRKEGVIA